MKIAQICPYSLSVPGGVQAQVLGLAHALRELGHDTRVLAPCDGPPPDANVTPLGKSIPTAVNGSVAPIAPDPACALRTLHALRNERFDVLHLHEPIVPGPTLTALMASDTPMVGTFHAAGTRTAYAKTALMARPLARRLCERIAVSADARDTAARAIGGAFTMLFNGIDIEQFRREPRVKTANRIVFFLGRHEQRKGLEVLLAATAHLPHDVQLWIGGEGPQTAQLRECYAQDQRVHWLGRLSDAEKVRCLRVANVFCAPSIGGESFGLVLLEAMAAETPIVASHIPGYEKVTRNGRDAQLVTAEDPQALAEGICRVLDDSALAQRLVDSGNVRVNEFSMHALAAAYVEIYQQCKKLQHPT